MGSTSRISLLPRRKRGMLCLWIWAILDTKHQCVPLIRVNSRCEETTDNRLNICKRIVLLFDSLLALSSHLPDTVHCLWPRTRRKRLWRGPGKAFLWGICQQVQAWCQVEAKGFGSAVPGVWKAEKAHERQLVRPATQHRVLHEWHRCVWKNEQVTHHHHHHHCFSAMKQVNFNYLKFSAIRGQFEDMCADLLPRVEPPLQSLLENTSKCTSGFSLLWGA